MITVANAFGYIESRPGLRNTTLLLEPCRYHQHTPTDAFPL